MIDLYLYITQTGFLSFIAARFPSVSPEQNDYRDLVFNTDRHIVTGRGDFSKSGNMII